MKKVETSLLALQKMLSPLSHEESHLLLSMLTQVGFSNYEQTPKITKEAPPDLSLKDLISRIHPTWFIEPLAPFSKNDRSFFYAALPSTTREALKAHFHDTTTPLDLNPQLEQFALTFLFQEAFGKDSPLPFSFLPADPLLPLVTASYDEILSLARFLGLFDVSPELKKVIKASTLRNIEKALTQEELSFIHEIRNHKPTLSFAEIGLKSFEGNSQILRETILTRGLNRLAKALDRVPEPLVWYILHTLDVNHSTLLKKMMVEIKDSRSYSILVDQVIFTWNKLCTPSHS